MNFDDRYNIIRPLGSGGMGNVVLAYDKSKKMKVAVKRLKRDLIRQKDLIRFRREADLLRAAKHPNILEVFDTYFDRDEPFFSMKYCSQGDITNIVTETLSNFENLKLRFGQISDALDHIHSLNPKMIHRDIKPGNVLIGDDGHLKISDFGLGRTLEDATITSTNWGSHGFTAPEQYIDMHNVDERADLYSLGAVGYYLYTGIAPSYFGARVRDRINNGVLSPIISCLLSHDQWDRLSSARLIKKAIDKLEEFVEYPNFETAWFSRCRQCRGHAIVVDFVSNIRITDEVTHCLSCSFVENQNLSRR